MLNPNEKNHELIAKYFEEELTSEEKQALEYKLQSDPDFKKDFELYQQVSIHLEALATAPLVKDLDLNIDPNTRHRFHWEKSQAEPKPLPKPHHLQTTNPPYSMIGVAVMTMILLIWVVWQYNSRTRLPQVAQEPTARLPREKPAESTHTQTNQTTLPNKPNNDKEQKADNQAIKKIEPEKKLNLLAENFKRNTDMDKMRGTFRTNGNALNSGGLRILSPQNDKLYQESVEFRWESGENAQWKVLILSNVGNEVKEIPSPKTNLKVDIKDLTPGLYYWQLYKDLKEDAEELPLHTGSIFINAKMEVDK
ncbi:MAG: hypothetical protein MUE85_14405 [Microscillaceae bacterium]|jgi:hypothetical protein|nr:hypothetical protein [Microscillaceae bacterium]